VDVLAGRERDRTTRYSDCVVAGMLIFRRAMLAAMMTEDAPAEKAESIVLGALASVGYTVPTPIPLPILQDVVALTLYVRNYAKPI
jgi:hypothetical protein